MITPDFTAEIAAIKQAREDTHMENGVRLATKRGAILALNNAEHDLIRKVHLLIDQGLV